MLAAMVISCTLPGTDPLQTAVVVNQTDTDVVVFLAYPDREASIMELQPGESDSTSFGDLDGCAPAALIARDISGVEIARRDPPFCVGERWEIQN